MNNKNTPGLLEAVIILCKKLKWTAVGLPNQKTGNGLNAMHKINSQI